MKTQVTTEQFNQITFGVEIESIIPYGLCSVGHYHSGRAVTQAPAFNGVHWTASSDSSIHARNGEACEFVSPILKGEAGLNNLIEFLGWLKAAGVKVNKSCGLHVHIGVSSVMPNATVDEVMGFLARAAKVAKKYQVGIYAQTGTDRHANRYCQPLNDEDKATVESAEADPSVTSKRAKLCSIDRYRMLNISSFAHKGTIEFRAFAGTINPAKVLNHVFTAIGVALRARDQGEVLWKDYTYSGLNGFTYVWSNIILPALKAAPAIKSMKTNMLKWGMGMAARWDLRNGAMMTENHRTALAAVRRLINAEAPAQAPAQPVTI